MATSLPCCSPAGSSLQITTRGVLGSFSAVNPYQARYPSNAEAVEPINVVVGELRALLLLVAFTASSSKRGFDARSSSISLSLLRTSSGVIADRGVFRFPDHPRVADDFVDHTVLDSLLGSHDVVAVGVALYLLVGLACALAWNSTSET